jgi:DNA-binding GntR family transcriptional regulator
MKDRVNARFEGGNPLTPIERRTLNEIAYARLKKALLSGRLEPGHTLTLRGLAATLGTSVMPVRDAVGRLAAEHAFELLPNRGIRIPRLTPEHADELWGLRIDLEGEAAALAAPRVTPDELAEIERWMQELCARAAAGDLYGGLDANDSLQFAMYRAAKTHVLLRLIETLRMQSMPHCTASLRRLFAEQPPFLAETLDHSKAVVEAIARGDAGGAREAKRRDLEGLRGWVESCAAEESEFGPLTPLASERAP